MLLKTAIEMIEHQTAGFKNANPSVCIEVFRRVQSAVRPAYRLKAST